MSGININGTWQESILAAYRNKESCDNCRYREMRVSLQEKAEPYCGLFLRWIENLRVCNCWMGKEKNDG